MELYAERGFEQATVAEIAERAGVTARTFFRYYTDKREVLFAGSDALGERLLAALDAVPSGEPPLAAIATALETVTSDIGGDRTHSRRRQAIIVANAELQERELTKMASWSRLLADGLRRRGVEDVAAGLAAETGVAVFRVTFERWIAASSDVTLTDTLRASFDVLRGMAGAN